MSEENESVIFPKKIENRPGLNSLNYRIGTYSTILEAFIQKLDRDRMKEPGQGLRGFTYRGSDDPAIALIESTSILCDILTFYQELYINEAFLGPAKWTESISRLVELTGYRLSPGITGTGLFSADIKGEKLVVIPESHPLKCQIEGSDQPVYLETIEELTAYSELNIVLLYPLIQLSSKSSSNLKEFWVFGNDISEQVFKLGDSILFLRTISNGNEREISVIKNSSLIHGNEIIKLSKSLDTDIFTSESSYNAYKLGRSYPHFGSNAPIFYSYESGDEILAGTTHYNRKDTSVWNIPDHIPDFDTTEFPIAGSHDNFSPGSFVVLISGSETAYLEIQEVYKESKSWGSITGECTILVFNEDIDGYLDDIKQAYVHEILSEVLEVRPGIELQTDSVNEFLFFGDSSLLPGRQIIVSHPDKSVSTIHTRIGSVREYDLDSEFLQNSDCHIVQLADFPTSSYDSYILGSPLQYLGQEYQILGNVVSADQGRTEKEIVLGSGDRRQVFQEFRLPKTPLKFIRSEEDPTIKEPELEIYVNGCLWEFVPSFYNRSPREEIYTVRRDEEGYCWVQFGNGKTGARLPSGIDNVTAVYRTGLCANGYLKDGTSVQLSKSITNLKKMNLVDSISGGQLPEEGGVAREAAPGKLQSLGRMVSLKDYENEILASFDVIKARAMWVLDSLNTLPQLEIVVLLNPEGSCDAVTIQNDIRKHDKYTGPRRYPIIVNTGSIKYIKLECSCRFDKTISKIESTKERIKDALGVFTTDSRYSAKGLFGIDARTFGQPELITKIQGIIQNVSGVSQVSYVSVKVLGLTYNEQYYEVIDWVECVDTIPCGETSLLRLMDGDLVIKEVE